MSYTNGIGGLQQAISSITPAEAKQPVQTNTSGSVASADAASTVISTGADYADLSSTGGLVGRALEGSDARLDKVASLQQAIANGSYNVSSQDVADRIIGSLLD